MEIGGIGSRVGVPYFVQRKQNIEQSVSAGAVVGMPADAMENAGAVAGMPADTMGNAVAGNFGDVLNVAEASLQEPKEHIIRDLGIGFVFVGDYGMGMHANQISNPNLDDVIVRVSMSPQDESIDVNVSKVDPTQASAVEMFAFCQYADATGTGVDDKWGSWHALKFFASPMEALEYKSYNDAMYKKQDWTMALAGNADYSLKSQSTGETLDVYDVFKMLKSTLVEQHKLTAKDTKAEDDWRKMEDEKWQKLIERIDRYINASVEELKKIREAQNEAINVAASEAPAGMKSQAVNMALQNILLSGKMGTTIQVDSTNLEKSSWTYDLKTDNQEVLHKAKMANEYADDLKGKVEEKNSRVIAAYEMNLSEVYDEMEEISENG